MAAPVFGRPDVAEAAKLNIVAAGEPSTLDHVAPLFEAMGQNWYGYLNNCSFLNSFVASQFL